MLLNVMDNIAILVFDYSLLGGVQKVTYNLARLLGDEGFPVKCLISICDSGKVHYPYQVPVEIVGDDTDMYRRIDSVVAKYKIQQVIVQMENLKFLYPIINHLTESGCRVHPVLHSSPYNWIKKYYTLSEYLHSPRHIFQWLKMQLYWKPMHLSLFREIVDKHGVICVSAQARQEMCEIMDLLTDTQKVKYVYNPILTEASQLGEKENAIVYAGRIDADKRPMLMIQVWNELEKAYPCWTFYMLGDGPELQKVKNYITRHRLQHVRTEGTVSNVPDYLKKSKISILFSKYEGLPTVMLEACYNDNALVATINDGGTRDVVKDGVNGRLVNAKDFHGIVEILKELMADNGKVAERLAKTNYEIRKQFETTEIVNRWRYILS